MRGGHFGDRRGWCAPPRAVAPNRGHAVRSSASASRSPRHAATVIHRRLSRKRGAWRLTPLLNLERKDRVHDIGAPPSTCSVCPVMKPAWSMHRSATALPISAGVPTRPRGVQPPSCQFLIFWNTSVGSRPTTLSSVVRADHVHRDATRAESNGEVTRERWPSVSDMQKCTPGSPARPTWRPGTCGGSEARSTR